MYKGKPPALWRGRPLSPAIRHPMRVPRNNPCEMPGIGEGIEARRPSTSPYIFFFNPAGSGSAGLIPRGTLHAGLSAWALTLWAGAAGAVLAL